MRLTDRAIARLRPREQEYTVWDNQFVGLGVRVRPTGGRSYVLLEDTGGRSRRVSLGPVSLKTVAEVRRECHARKAEPEATDAPRRVTPLFRDFVEGTWKEAHFEGYKPSTRKGVRSVLDRQLLPAFGSKPLDRITLAQVTHWFDRFSRTAPGNANHALDLLRQIMNFAIARSHIDTNPALAVKRNRRQTLTRFLSREEIARLHRVLDRQTSNSSREQADIIRLLLLTGCRRSEIVRLRWSEVDRDKLVLADSKTGPRTVIRADFAKAERDAGRSDETARCFADFPWTPLTSWSRERRLVARAEWMLGRGEPPLHRHLAAGKVRSRHGPSTRGSTASAATWRTASRSASSTRPAVLAHRNENYSRQLATWGSKSRSRHIRYSWSRIHS